MKIDDSWRSNASRVAHFINSGQLSSSFDGGLNWFVGSGVLSVSHTSPCEGFLEGRKNI
jgi:hypothetical protein